MNRIWADYGCTVCNDYPIMVVEAGCYGNDSKDRWLTYINGQKPGYTDPKYKMLYITTWHQEGGKDFDRALGNNGSGNPKYWIKPDKTFKDYRSSDITNAGIEKHNCNVAIKSNLNKNFRTGNITLSNAYKSGFVLKVSKTENYKISFYSVNGKLKTALSKRLVTGSQKINFENSLLVNGLYIVELKHGQNIDRVKVILK